MTGGGKDVRGSPERGTGQTCSAVGEQTPPLSESRSRHGRLGGPGVGRARQSSQIRREVEQLSSARAGPPPPPPPPPPRSALFAQQSQNQNSLPVRPGGSDVGLVFVPSTLPPFDFSLAGLFALCDCGPGPPVRAAASTPGSDEVESVIDI